MSVIVLLGLFAQTSPSDGWGDLLATYGPFAPFAALLLWLLQLLWKDNKEKESEIRRLTETAMERIIPLVLEATNVLSDAIDSLREVKANQREAQRTIAVMESLQRTVEDLRAANLQRAVEDLKAELTILEPILREGIARRSQGKNS